MAAGSRPEVPDVGRIVDALARHDVDYLLVGGVAARAHGTASPMTSTACPPARRTTSTAWPRRCGIFTLVCASKG
jgi:hypothetical protein